MAELVVAMVIIASVIISLIAIQISAALTIADARGRQQATALANEAMEQMRSIPWNVLSKGLDYDYLVESGGDPFVSAGNLTVDGKTEQLVVATETQDQDTSNPWTPLFDSTGSNKQVRTDPSGLMTMYSIRAYVTKPAGSPDTILGLAVIVEWSNSEGSSNHATVWSSAYRGSGCGDLDTQPYLGACQAILNASSTSGSIVSQLTASSEPPTVVELPLLGPPGPGDMYLESMRSAGVAASVASQQVTISKAVIQYGGTTMDDDEPSTQPELNGWEEGFAIYELQASDDDAWAQIPENPPDLVINQSSSDETRQGVTSGDGTLNFWELSDYRRPGTADASSTTSCAVGIPDGEPCAKASIDNWNDLDGGSAYVIMEVDSTIIRLARRLYEAGTNVEHAWAARFVDSPGTSSSVGCTGLSGEGCVSAGADRTMATLSIGTVVTGTTTWDGDAPDGLVIVKGRSGCPAGLTSSVLVQRGASQMTTSSTISRCGAVDYWNGVSYSTVNIDKLTDTSFDTAPVTWSNGNYTVSALGNVSVSPVTDIPDGPSDCVNDSCMVTAEAGVISIVVAYTITHGADSWVVYSWTTVNPPRATAEFKKAPVA